MCAGFVQGWYFLIRKDSNGGTTRIRTENLELRRLVLYPIELWSLRKAFVTGEVLI